MKNLFGETSLVDILNLEEIKINKVFLIEEKKEVIKLLKSKKINFEIVSKNYFNKFSDINHQFIHAIIQTNNEFDSIDEWFKKTSCNNISLILMVDSIEDPRNFGSIIRTSLALGVDAIIYKKDNQTQLSDLVHKTSMGASFRIPLIRVKNLSQTIEKLKEKKYWIYCSTLDNKSVAYNQIKYDNKSVLIVGNEHKGVSKLVVKNSDFYVKIPMKNEFNSLNVSVATGILISEILKK